MVFGLHQLDEHLSCSVCLERLFASLFSPHVRCKESDKPLEILSRDVPGAKERVIRNNNSVKENLDDMNLFPLDLSHTNQFQKKELNLRK